MKGKIDKEGVLWLERAGKLKVQACANDGECFCSDVCPLFKEPISLDSGKNRLPLCKTVWDFDEFEDERIDKFAAMEAAEDELIQKYYPGFIRTI